MTTTTLERPASILDQPVTALFVLSWEKVLYAVLFVGALATRFYDLGARTMSHDESLHTQFAWYLFQGRGFQHSPLMHGVLRFEITAFIYWLLGDTDFTSRIVPALFGVALVLLMYAFRKWIGRTGALLASFMVLISPYLLYYSRYLRDEPFVLVWGTLLALCVIKYMETRSDKYLYGLAAVTALFYTTMEASYIYVAISMLFLGLHLVRELFAVRWPKTEYRQPFQIAFFLTLAALVLAGGFIFLGHRAAATGAETAVPVNPGSPAAAVAPSATAAGLSQVGAVAAGVALVGLAAGFYFVIRAFGDEVRRFPAVDLLMVLGLFVLPQLTAFPVKFLQRDPQNYTIPPGTNFFSFFATDGGVTATVCVLLLAASIAIGLVWDRRRFLICAAIFYSIFITLFTTFFTNGWGIATGTIGSLGYWLAQQGVQRGNQPWYYYLLINLPIYEFLPTIGALFAGYLLLRHWLKLDQSQPPDTEAEAEAAAHADEPISPADTLGFPVIGYIGFWGVMSIVAFTLAGEKMPWLTDHITLPLIILSGWAIGKFIDESNWTLFRERRAWLVALLLPVTVVALAAAFGSLLGANPPFQGTELSQLQSTGVFFSGALVGLIGAVALYGLGAQLGFQHVLRLGFLSIFALLALLTMRTAFIASYVNYDDANEFLVYAHGALGVKTVMTQIEDISMRTKDGFGLKVAYDSDVAWPMTWYLRDYTNQSYYGDTPTRESLDAPVVISGPKHWSKVESLLGDRYYQFEYIRMVWPMQEYFNLTWQRISFALTSPQYRQAIWNIWTNRDYTLYGTLTSTNYDLSQWPVSERMRMYVRKDVASQIWSYGVGPATVTGSGAAPSDPYVAAKQVFKATNMWGSEGAAPGQFEAPRGVAVAPDGSIYVADSRNNRIEKFDPTGKLLVAWGTFGSLDAKTANPGTFNEPWGVAVGADGSVYVTDTWNHRVQKFDANGQFIKMWGIFGQGETPDAFWGPRAIVIDGQGRLYVSDTGNKRIVVFDGDGNSLNTIGSAGSDPGQFDEPVGLAVTKDGTVYVADTWNQRIQQFGYDAASNTYSFVRQWPITAWFGQSIDNKPFMALDSKNRLYVTDPEGYRILVFDEQGKFLTTWGDFGTDDSTFGLAAALAIDSTGKITVTDAGNHRVMQFPALP